MALGDITPRLLSLLPPCPWSIAEALSARLGAHPWLCRARQGRECCHRVSIAPYCRFDLQHPALARSLPFLPPGAPCQGVGTTSELVSPFVTAQTPWIRPQIQAQHPCGDPIPTRRGVGISKKLHASLMAGIGNGEPAVLHPKSLGAGGDVLTVPPRQGPALVAAMAALPPAGPAPLLRRRALPHPPLPQPAHQIRLPELP